MKNTRRYLLLALGAAIAMPAVALAEPSYAVHDAQIHGRIAGVQSRDRVLVRDDHGYLDRVHLHQGTGISPVGISLAQGMPVRIYGHPRGDVFEADDVVVGYEHRAPSYADDTSYEAYDAPVYDAPAYPAYGYPYPYYGYGYGPYASTAIVFGGGCCWGGGWHGGGWRR